VEWDDACCNAIDDAWAAFRLPRTFAALVLAESDESLLTVVPFESRTVLFVFDPDDRPCGPLTDVPAPTPTEPPIMPPPEWPASVGVAAAIEAAAATHNITRVFMTLSP
jgi:hypothetical protein